MQAVTLIPIMFFNLTSSFCLQLTSWVHLSLCNLCVAQASKLYSYSFPLSQRVILHIFFSLSLHFLNLSAPNGVEYFRWDHCPLCPQYYTWFHWWYPGIVFVFQNVSSNLSNVDAMLNQDLWITLSRLQKQSDNRLAAQEKLPIFDR